MCGGIGGRRVVDVLSTQSTSDPDVVKGIKESMVVTSAGEVQVGRQDGYCGESSASSLRVLWLVWEGISAKLIWPSR